MTYRYQPSLVSQYANDDQAVKEQHEHYELAGYRAEQIKSFIKATCKALGAAHCNLDYGSAVIYRPGDTHVLGEIGFKDIRVKGKGASDPQYYVRARTIANGKYRDTIWQHNIIGTKSMKNAVKHAEEYFKPVPASEAIRLTATRARSVVDKAVSVHFDVVRNAYRQLFGDSGYGNKFDTPIFQELRHSTFISPQVSKLMAEFFEGLDAWREAKGIIEKGIHYVSLTDNYGQLVADTAHCGTLFGHDNGTSEVTRLPATELPEWMQGRLAVLQMLKPENYVQGVGLRLDDKVFYIMGDTTDEE
jgi:hypothetical protein